MESILPSAVPQSGNHLLEVISRILSDDNWRGLGHPIGQSVHSQSPRFSQTPFVSLEIMTVHAGSSQSTSGASTIVWPKPRLSERVRGKD
jgi:hypothetical protein